MKFGAVVAGSVAGSVAVVAHAFSLKKQFYPATVYLVNSGLGMTVGAGRLLSFQAIYIQLMLVCFLAVRGLSLVFFGKLRPAEAEVSHTPRPALMHSTSGRRPGLRSPKPV